MCCPESCRYLCGWYYVWAVRTRILKTAAILLLVAFVLDVVAVTASYWLVGPLGYTGLFDRTVKAITDRPVSVPILCPILSVLSAVILLCDNILNLFFVTRQYYLVMPAVIVFAFIAALMQMTVIVTWSSPDVTSGQRLSWSFIVAAVSVVVDLAACGLCVLDFLSRHSRIRTTANNTSRVSESATNEMHSLNPDSTSTRESTTGSGICQEEDEEDEGEQDGGNVAEEIEMRTF